MSGALMQLVAVGNQNQSFNNMYCVDYLTHDFNYNSLKILRNGDLCIPLYLSFEMKRDMDVNQFYEIISKSQIKLSLGSYECLNIELSFLSKLNPIKKVNDLFIIKLPFDLLIGHLALISLSFISADLIIDIETEKRSHIERITGMFEYIYQDTKERSVFAQHYIYQKILVINSSNYNQIKSNDNLNYSDYIIDFEEPIDKIGIFIEADQEINSLNILFNDKKYGLSDCSIINYNLVYFSFNNLEYNDKENLSIELTTIQNLVISSQVSNLKFRLIQTKVIHYHSGFLFPYSDIYKKYNFCNFKQNLDYNMYTKIVSVPVLINEFFGKKVYDFIKKNINDVLINTTLNTDPTISIVRFFDCTISTYFELPPNINIIIFEKCDFDLTNMSCNVSEVWLINSKEQSNLPYGLQKLRLFGKYDVEYMKIPFGCEIEYIGQ